MRKGLVSQPGSQSVNQSAGRGGESSGVSRVPLHSQYKGWIQTEAVSIGARRNEIT